MPKRGTLRDCVAFRSRCNLIPGLQACIGRDFDFVFDTDRPGWRRPAGLLEIGCREVFREELHIDAEPDWKRPMTTFQFLVDCR